MSKIQKIQEIKELVNAPQMPNIAKGLYTRFEETAIYKHKTKGFEIELTELLNAVKQLPHLQTTIVGENDSLPWYVLVEKSRTGQKRENSLIWQETKTYSNEIICQTKECCELVSKFFENE